jgi:hypothetical protein
MDRQQIEELVTHLESHLECWRQFSAFVNQARAKDFDEDDESEFLEIKSNLVQQIEIIRNFIEEGGPPRDEIHDLIADAPSLRAISELTETAHRTLENKWHKIFVGWQTVVGQIKASDKELGIPELLAQLENHIEYWKQFHDFIVLAQGKSWSMDDEQQFLEVKSGMVQELEVILGAITDGAPDRLDIHDLISNAPSIHYMNELGENSLRTLENNWHKIYLGWQGVIGQLKIAQQELGVDELVSQLENHIECLKQFNQFLVMARSEKFNDDDEVQFLEIKSGLAQELEMILGSIEEGAPPRDEIHDLIANAPSLKYLAALNESSQRTMENNWHKLFLDWQAILGKLKVAQQQAPKSKGFFSRLFGG